MVRVLRSDVTRKPWGQGKAAQQKHVRNRIAFEVSQLIQDRLDWDQVQMTGQLFPRGTLKKPANKKVFSWVHSYSGRVWTKALLKQVVRNLVRAIQNIPMDPSKPFGHFVKQQSKRLGILIRQAKRIKAGFPKTHELTKIIMGYVFQILFSWGMIVHICFTKLAQNPTTASLKELAQEDRRNPSSRYFQSSFNTQIHIFFPIDKSHLLHIEIFSQDPMDQLETQPWARDPT